VTEDLAVMIAFAEARLEEDKRIAMGACGIGWPRVIPDQPETWHWECCDDDEPLDVDLAIAGVRSSCSTAIITVSACGAPNSTRPARWSARCATS
jgi:hypothetical protein